MRRGKVWWAEFDERRPVVLVSAEDPSGFQAVQVVAASHTDIAGLGVEAAVGVQEGPPFDGVLRFVCPAPGFNPVHAWLTTLSREDLIDRAGVVPAAKPSEIKDSLCRRTQADREAMDAPISDGRSRHTSSGCAFTS